MISVEGSFLPEWWTEMNPSAKCLFLAVCFALVGSGALIHGCVQADGRVSYCLVAAERNPNSPAIAYKLEGVRPWRVSNTYGYFGNFDEAVTAAGKINCPIGK